MKMSELQRRALAKYVAGRRAEAGWSLVLAAEVAEENGDAISPTWLHLVEVGGLIDLSAEKLSILARLFAGSPPNAFPVAPELVFQQLSDMCIAPWAYVPSGKGEA